MLCMLISTTKPDLDAAAYARLADLAREFYADIPDGIALRGNWASSDGTHAYALLEARDIATIERTQAPFAPYVDCRIVAVREISGWEVS